jgi:predicted MPP superfamily phosphohydrolase
VRFFESVAAAAERYRGLPWAKILRLAFGLFAVALAVTAQSITFIQITDAHLFDAGQHRPLLGGFLDALDNRGSLIWAIQEIDRRVSSGQSIDFIAFTGDFGLEKTTPQDAAREVSLYFRALLVRKIFLLPGNNDVRDEDPANVPEYHRFVNELARLLPDHDIVDLVQLSQTIHGIHMLGLDSSTFKNDYGRLSHEHEQQQMNDLDRLAAQIAPNQPNVVFTHIPNLQDPYEAEPGKYRKAWNLAAIPAKRWQELVNRPDVIGVFAGHFHDPRRIIYMHDYSWAVKKPDLNEGRKTWVAPPLAVKFQVGLPVQARGLLFATVSATGAVTATPKWFGYANTAVPDKAAPGRQ